MTLQPDRALSPVEELRIRAETDKILLETKLLELKNAAEIRAIDAEAEFNLAQARKLEVEAGYTNTADKINLMDLESKERQRSIEMANDLYYHVYRFLDEVDERAAVSCMDRLSLWHRLDPKCDMTIVFTSPGGDVTFGMALFDHILDMRSMGHKVTTRTVGMAASMAGILLQAGTKRVMSKESWVLIHQLSFGAHGKIGDVEDRVEWVKKIGERVLDIFSERCAEAGVVGTAKEPLTRDQLEKAWTRKDWWLSSDDCLKYGLVDEVG